MSDDQPITITVDLSPADVAVVAGIVYDSVRAMRVHLKAPGERIQPTWEFAKSDVRHDTEVAVRRIGSGKVTSAQQLHEQWRDEQYRAGWRYGPVLDEGAQISPHLCEYPGLDPLAQARYSLLYAVAANVLASMALIITARNTNLYNRRPH